MATPVSLGYSRIVPQKETEETAKRFSFLFSIHDGNRFSAFLLLSGEPKDVNGPEDAKKNFQKNKVRF
jgi:hypothetical protein